MAQESIVVHEEFAGELSARWRRYLVGSGELDSTGGSLRFVNRNARSKQYSNAQIDDYQGLARRGFPWSPPLTLTVRARFSHSRAALLGTAGFGFWNDPFWMTGRRVPTLPRAIWFFFASSPSNMKLDLQTPGCGWKAATIDAMRWPVLALVPFAPLAIALMNVRTVYRALWPLVQRIVGVSEVPIRTDITDWHTYVVEWGAETARFYLDHVSILECDTPPRGPLGFVMWLDNQYAVATPWGRFGSGLLDVPDCQWMEVDSLIIDTGTD